MRTVPKSLLSWTIKKWSLFCMGVRFPSIISEETSDRLHCSEIHNGAKFRVGTQSFYVITIFALILCFCTFFENGFSPHGWQKNLPTY